eukprot:scaffold6009_cov103-Skeletonema_dohrnii-CCMP3373.AAC.1
MRGWLSNLRGDQSQRDSGSSAAAGNSSSSGAEAPPSTLPQSPPLTRGGNNNNDNDNDRRGTGRLTAGRSFRSGGNGGNGDGPANNNTSSGGGGGGGGVIQALMAGRGGGAAFADAEMERKVSISARNLGDGVSRIVLAARMGGGSSGQSGNDPEEWKVRLLKLLGGSDEDNKRTSNGDSSALTEDGVASGGGNNEAPSDIDILLENSTCERFVLRCVENELPPNLIHCLRLLRVLELQHDHSVAQKQQQLRRSRRSDYGENNDGHEGDLIVPASPLSTQAAAKVSKLLCLLCSDPSVGEQLRPHLFGLLALSGASYPNSGVHIAAAASDVILAFSRSCLSASLVWFLHDRKMIVHMTDDIKELCAMTGSGPSSPSSSNNSSSGNNRCLYGKDAEEKGLWVIAIRTVVHLVSNSCHYQCVELLKDYDSAGGYHVLAYAISNSSMKHVPKLLELVTALVCCKIGATSSAMSSTPSSQEHLQDEEMLANDNNDSTDLAEAKMAMNTNAFEIMDDLMVRSLKLIVAYKAEHDGRRPDFSSTSDLTAMTDFAVKYAWDMTMQATTSIDDAENDVGVDLTSELLVTTLQLYSDHAKNFDLIESEYHMLSHYILGFPAFSDVSVKVFSLKTLEYVCTGLAGANTFMPLRLVTELFISLCKHLLKEAAARPSSEDDEAKAKAMEDSALDLQLLCETLIKLLEFDEKVSEVMLECGLLGPKIDDMLDLLFAITGADLPDEGEDVLISNLPRPSPADSTNVDDIFSSLCRVLKVVVRHPRARSVIGERGSAAGDIIH